MTSQPVQYVKAVGLAFGMSLLWGVPAMADAPKLDQATLDKIRIFTEVLDVVQTRFVDETQDADLIEDALNGFLRDLDPHSKYVSAEKFEEQTKASLREYGGLGIEVVLEDGLVLIRYVTEGGPADKAGLVAGDFVTEVKGESILGKTLNDAVKDMRGPKGEPINITVLSEDGTQRTLDIVRDIVIGRVVRHRMEDGVGYVHIDTFSNPHVARDTEKAIKSLQAEAGGQLSGLVLDLRSNRGGLVTETIKVSSLFLNGGEVMSSRTRDPKQTERYNAEDGQLLAGVPIIVMINSLSASASEIVAGAVKDRGRGLILGMTSFGKGSVQSVIPIEGGKRGALRLTTARYYTPSGLSIQGTGIEPDIAVYHRPDDGEETPRFSEADFDNAISNTTLSQTQARHKDQDIDFPPEGWDRTEDYQLKRAIEIIKSGEYRQRLSQAAVDAQTPTP